MPADAPVMSAVRFSVKMDFIVPPAFRCPEAQMRVDHHRRATKKYSRWIGREELFERERGSDPDFQVWDECALACDFVESTDKTSESSLLSL